MLKQTNNLWQNNDDLLFQNTNTETDADDDPDFDLMAIDDSEDDFDVEAIDDNDDDGVGEYSS